MGKLLTTFKDKTFEPSMKSFYQLYTDDTSTASQIYDSLLYVRGVNAGSLTKNQENDDATVSTVEMHDTYMPVRFYNVKSTSDGETPTSANHTFFSVYNRAEYNGGDGKNIYDLWADRNLAKLSGAGYVTNTIGGAYNYGLDAGSGDSQTIPGVYGSVNLASVAPTGDTRTVSYLIGSRDWASLNKANATATYVYPTISEFAQVTGTVGTLAMLKLDLDYTAGAVTNAYYIWADESTLPTPSGEKYFIKSNIPWPTLLSSTLTNTGAVTFQSTLSVSGTATLSSNVNIGGNLVVTGTSTFNGGTITMGDANTDNVVFGADVDSNIIPDDDNTYDLGSSSQQWKDIYINGTAYLDAMDIDGNVQIDGTLTVGVDDTGYDVKFFGDTASKYMLWDTSGDTLFFPDNTKITLGTGSDAEIYVNSDDLYINASGQAIYSTANQHLITTNEFLITSATSTRPLVNIKNTTNNEYSPTLWFTADRGVAAQDGDSVGLIAFLGEDDGQNQTEYARIQATISESADTDEAGKLTLYVAESDGTNTALTAGLTLEGEHATDGEVDVIVGAGAGSTVTIPGSIDLAGSIDVDGTSNLDAVDIDGAVQIDGTVGIGVDGTGQDVKFFGDTSGKFMLWDQSEDALQFTDDTKLTLGTGSDASMYVNSDDLYIVQDTTDKSIIFQCDDGSGGTEEYFRLDGSEASANPHTNFPDNSRLTFGAGEDIEIYSDGSSGHIHAPDGQNLSIVSSYFAVKNIGTTENVAIFNDNADCELYYDGTLRLQTTNTGVDLDGNVDISGELINRKRVENVTGNVSGTAASASTAGESGSVYVLNDASGNTITLPDNGAPGMGDNYQIGWYCDVIVAVTATSGTHKVVAADTSNTVFIGHLHAIDTDTSNTDVVYTTGGSTSAVSMNGTTTGIAGSKFRLTSIAVDKWHIEGHVLHTGSTATPFSDT